MKSEADIQRACMIAASKLGAIVWRNNTGMLRNSNGIPVKYGLCKGSSDIIGIYRGRFLAIEVKTPKGRVSKEQENFIDIVNKAGGIAFVARHPDDVINFLTNVS